jgi:hypothetical protein
METVNAAESGTAAAYQPAILYPLMLIASIAVIVFNAVGIATTLGWIPDVLSRTAVPSAQAAATAQLLPAPAAAPCRNCGSVESIAAIQPIGYHTVGVGNSIAGAGSPVTYEVRVRMHDGSYRMFSQRVQPALTVGQKVRVTEQGVVTAG